MICGVTDCHITMDKELQDMNRFMALYISFLAEAWKEEEFSFLAEITWRLKLSWSSTKANILT